MKTVQYTASVQYTDGSEKKELLFYARTDRAAWRQAYELAVQHKPQGERPMQIELLR